MAGNNYGATSLKRLGTAHEELDDLMKAVGIHFPNTILEAERSEEQHVNLPLARGPKSSCQRSRPQRCCGNILERVRGVCTHRIL